jgi:hypothetical protein
MARMAWVAIAVGGLSLPISALAEEPFGQERVATREFRTPQKLKGHSHEHGGHGHEHAHGGDDDDEGHGHADGEGGHDHAHGTETENLFGFTLGSDTDEAGAKGVAIENVVRTGKRAGAYRALGSKLEFAFAVTDDFSLSMSALGDCHRIRDVPEFDDVRRRCAFNGIGGEVRWRFLNRNTGPFGLTLHLEPSFARFDEESGKVGRKLGSENKLIFDRELVPDTLFGAVNLLYEPERMRERFALNTERGSVGGVAGALALRVSPIAFVGAEVRYLRAYEGLAFRRYQGDAVYVGPTLFAKLGEKGWIQAAWNAQVAGREAPDRRERAAAVVDALNQNAAAVAAGEDPPALTLPDFPGRRRLNLRNFERHQFRLKTGFEF